MAIVNLQSLLREPTYRLTDRTAFAQAVSRISDAQIKRGKSAQEMLVKRQKDA